MSENSNFPINSVIGKMALHPRFDFKPSRFDRDATSLKLRLSILTIIREVMMYDQYINNASEKVIASSEDKDNPEALKPFT